MGIREDALNANDRVIKPVEVREWGLTVYVRSLMGDEHDALHRRLFADQDTRLPFIDMEVQAIIASACDEAGCAVFHAEDAAILKKKNTAALRRLYEAFESLNVLSANREESVEKNSETTTAPSSGSGLQAT